MSPAALEPQTIPDTPKAARPRKTRRPMGVPSTASTIGTAVCLRWSLPVTRPGRKGQFRRNSLWVVEPVQSSQNCRGRPPVPLGRSLRCREPLLSRLPLRAPLARSFLAAVVVAASAVAVADPTPAGGAPTPVTFGAVADARVEQKRAVVQLPQRPAAGRLRVERRRDVIRQVHDERAGRAGRERQAAAADGVERHQPGRRRQRHRNGVDGEGPDVEDRSRQGSAACARFPAFRPAPGWSSTSRAQ